MLNEGMITNNAKTLVKSEVLRQLWTVERTTPDILERAVFAAMTGGYSREDVDWDVEDNQAGFCTWIRALDTLIEELIEDGYVRLEEHDDETRTLVATEVDPPIEYSYLAYP